MIFFILFGFAWANTYNPSNTGVWIEGRSAIGDDNNARKFDWENVSFLINLSNASYVKFQMKAHGNANGLFHVYVDEWKQQEVWVGGDAGSGNSFFAAKLQPKQSTSTIKIVNVLEPAFSGCTEATSYFEFLNFETDGVALEPTPRKRRMLLVGDSISAGYGSRGFAGVKGCPVTQITSGNPYTYDRYLADFFDAELSAIAWSGKGMYRNCCGNNGPTMPQLFLQTLGGNSSSRWSFDGKFDLVLINLGTNDFSNDLDPAEIQTFINIFVQFCQNVTNLYGKDVPIFIAQGPMNCGDKLKGALETVISKLSGSKVEYLSLCGPPTDGCGGHPGVEGHQQMFEMAKPVLSKIWSS